MKKLVIVAVVLVAVLLVAPLGIGKIAEKRVNQGLDQLLQQAPYLTIAERRWTAGWFKSEQMVTFEVLGTWMNAFTPKAIEEQLRRQSADENAESAAPADDLAESVDGSVVGAAVDAAPMDDVPVEEAPKSIDPIRFTVRNEILHGPLLGLSGLGVARVDSHLVLSEELEKQIAAFFGPKDPVEISTRVGFFGGATTVFKSEGRTITPADGKAEISWDTFKVAMGYSRNLDSYDLDGKWPRFEVRSPADGGLMRMSGMSVGGDFSRVRGDLYDGEFDLRIGEFELTADGKEVLVDDIHYVVTSDSKDDFTSFGIKVGSGAVRNANLAQVGVEFKAVHYDFSMRRLHTDTLVKILDGIKASYSKPVANVAELESAMFGPLKEQGLELLQHDPEFVFDRVGVDTDSGDGYLTGIIKLKGVTADDFAIGALAMVGKIDADLTIDVARALIEKFGGAVTVAGALESGYVEVKGDRLVCKLVFRDGELTINGKPQAIPGLGGPPPPQE